MATVGVKGLMFRALYSYSSTTPVISVYHWCLPVCSFQALVSKANV